LILSPQQPECKALVTFKRKFKVIAYGELDFTYAQRGRVRDTALKILFERWRDSKGKISFNDLSKQAGSNSQGMDPDKLFIHNVEDIEPFCEKVIRLVINWENDPDTKQCMVFLNPNYQYYTM
jgi:hypothetical protein